jgi:hypothetical protein
VTSDVWLHEPKDPAEKLVTVIVIFTGLLSKDGVFLVTTRQTITGSLFEFLLELALPQLRESSPLCVVLFLN